MQAVEIHLKGTPICQGVAIGRLYCYNRSENPIAELTLKEEEVHREIERYRSALEGSRAEIRTLQKQMELEKVQEGVAILGAHLQIMEDGLLTFEVEEEIRRTKKNAEYVFHRFILDFQTKFKALPDPFFQERFNDIQDIARRVMGYLHQKQRETLSSAPFGSVVITKELIASDVAEANGYAVKAFISEVGGVTAHAAIVAKAKGIPYVSNVDIGSIVCYANALIIVDGRTGDIFINPTPEKLKEYQAISEKIQRQLQSFNQTAQFEAETYDGYRVNLSANVEMVNEVDLLHQHSNSGVGLFRSEYLFLTQNDFPVEEEQFQIYQMLVSKMKGLPVVIRTFDVGGDKCIPNHKMPVEVNPFLGCRAIRFLLRELDIFKAQLRAILRASAFGNVSLMFPMVSTLTELIEAKKVVREVMQELKRSCIPFDEAIRIGCMIEVPSAAVIADLLAKECDFLSIGTNDLVQYSLAVDRSNQTMSGLYTPAHPSVIRLIRLVVNEAHFRGIPVTVCGEVAADPRFTPLLLGLGVNELSVTLRYLPMIKNVIRHTSIVEASHLAEQVLQMSTPQEIEQLLTDEYRRIFPEDHLQHVNII